MPNFDHDHFPGQPLDQHRDMGSEWCPFCVQWVDPRTQHYGATYDEYGRPDQPAERTTECPKCRADTTSHADVWATNRPMMPYDHRHS